MKKKRKGWLAILLIFLVAVLPAGGIIALIVYAIMQSKKETMKTPNDTMNIEVRRKHTTPYSTTGEMYIDGKFFAYTLEDPVRDKKVQDKTAIWPGTYDMIWNYSTRFKKEMPLVLDVPEFTGIRIHAGNTASDTTGCILVGNKLGKDYVGESKAAFDAFQAKTKDAKNVKITFTNQTVV